MSIPQQTSLRLRNSNEHLLMKLYGLYVIDVIEIGGVQEGLAMSVADKSCNMQLVIAVA